MLKIKPKIGYRPHFYQGFAALRQTGRQNNITVNPRKTEKIGIIYKLREINYKYRHPKNKRALNFFKINQKEKYKRRYGKIWRPDQARQTGNGAHQNKPKYFRFNCF